MNAHKRVMLVDDEEGVRVSWNRYLTGRGFDVTTADDGGVAIDELSKRPADVVVSDLKMPGVDGLRLLEWIHERQPDTRFILLTGYGTEEVERRARELGAFEYLNKPIGPDALAAVVTAAMHLAVVPEEAAPAPMPRVDETETEVAGEPQTPAPRSRLRGALEVTGGLIAAPLMGLAFVVFLPVIGFVTLFWFLGSSLFKRFRGPTQTGA
jgi:DNA-binding NtrC family response regulator